MLCNAPSSDAAAVRRAGCYTVPASFVCTLASPAAHAYARDGGARLHVCVCGTTSVLVVCEWFCARELSVCHAPCTVHRAPCTRSSAL
ncbi:hypothetical protein EON67_10375 [archaeon]|nr:MAG: hypothetical protein EON67_10375 [archaeon]